MEFMKYKVSVFDISAVSQKVVVFFILIHIANGFYNENEDFRHLSFDNIIESISDDPVLWLIEFYLSYCPHAAHYATIWREVAAKVKSNYTNFYFYCCSVMEKCEIGLHLLFFYFSERKCLSFLLYALLKKIYYSA